MKWLLLGIIAVECHTRGNLKLSINPLAPNDAHTVTQGAAFHFLMAQHMHQPIMVIPVQPCWSPPPFPFLSLHKKLNFVI